MWERGQGENLNKEKRQKMLRSGENKDAKKKDLGREGGGPSPGKGICISEKKNQDRREKRFAALEKRGDSVLGKKGF